MFKRFVLLSFLLNWITLSIHAEEAPNVLKNEENYDIQQSSVKTRDNATLAITVVRKKFSSKALPTVLFFTTYDQGVGDAIFGKRAVDRDYVGVVAYARGIRGDLNSYIPYEHDGRDVYDLIDWISKQSWSNGQVGMYGGSYTGFVQWATAKKLHPALKTIVPQVAVMPGFDTPMENNVQLTGLSLNWSNAILANKPLPQDLYEKWYATGSAYRDLDQLAGTRNRIFQKWLQHPAYDDYWQSLVPTSKEFAAITIPVLTTTGYYDGCQISALRYLQQHTKHNKNAEHYLVIGPYDHWGGQRRAAEVLNGYRIDEVAKIDMQSLAYDWLDYQLKGKSKPALLRNKINYQVMNSNQWRHVAALTQVYNEKLKFYLDMNTLNESAPTKIATLKQRVDFSDRDSQNNYFTPNIINDALDSSNGLVFSSVAFDREVELSGSFSGQLNLSSNKKDMDISIAFYEQMPDGRYFYLTRYLGRASFANDNSRRQLLTPYLKHAIPFDNVRMVAKKFAKGSKLVIVLNINKHPYEIINYGSGKDVVDETIADAAEAMEIEWHSDSFIEMPIFR